MENKLVSARLQTPEWTDKVTSTTPQRPAVEGQVPAALQARHHFNTGMCRPSRNEDGTPCVLPAQNPQQGASPRAWCHSHCNGVCQRVRGRKAENPGTQQSLCSHNTRTQNH